MWFQEWDERIPHKTFTSMSGTEQAAVIQILLKEREGQFADPRDFELAVDRDMRFYRDAHPCRSPSDM